MRRAAALAALVLTIAIGDAAARESVDVYIRGEVLGRAAPANLADVEIRWDYKCFGDKLGASTFEWTLKVVRKQPLPEQTTALQSGTSKTGSVRSRLAPGQYLLTANPFRCATDRGAGTTEPEIGETIVVPDYCAWRIERSSGRVTVERGGTVKAGAAGALVRGAETLVTGTGSATIANEGAHTRLRVARGARIHVDSPACARAGGWKLVLGGGAVEGTIAERRTGYTIATANAAVGAVTARLRVEAARKQGKPWTRVAVKSGRATVTVRGRRTALPAGATRTIVG
jgi:hypothetical protein